MFSKFDDVQKLGRDHMDGALKSFGAMSRGIQSIALETADHSKSSFEASTAAFEQLLGARTFGGIVEVQNEYAKASYESFLAYGRKLGDLVAETTRESLKPYEQAFNGAAEQADRVKKAAAKN
jgi:phasin family protein